MLRLKDARSGLLRSPLKIDDTIGLYVCGPTVAGAPHLGHLRTAYAYDTLVRWLRASGDAVKFTQNITDIDDKILAKSLQEERSWEELARAYEHEFSAMRSTLGLIEPDDQPRATEHIPLILELIQRLIDNGVAYVADDGSANVYFSVEKDPQFGSFTNQTLASLEGNPNIHEGESVHATGKRHKLDFALWKASKAHEPKTASWEAPWGLGRPGWHVEDTAMAVKSLGEGFSLHGGGRDLRLPHHESEVAQARGAGYPYADLWVHSGLVTVKGEKMAKSKNNFELAEDHYAKDHEALRLLFTRTHYASDVKYSEKEYDSALSAWRRIEGLVRQLRTINGDQLPLNDEYALLPQAFVDALNNDLNTPAAYAVVFDHVKSGYGLLERGAPTDQMQAELLAMLSVLGFKLDSKELPTKAQELLKAREAARIAKDYALSDSLRESLKAHGVHVKDTKNGQEYELVTGGNHG